MWSTSVACTTYPWRSCSAHKGCLRSHPSRALRHCESYPRLAADSLLLSYVLASFLCAAQYVSVVSSLHPVLLHGRIGLLGIAISHQSCYIVLAPLGKHPAVFLLSTERTRNRTSYGDVHGIPFMPGIAGASASHHLQPLATPLRRVYPFRHRSMHSKKPPTEVSGIYASK